MSTFVWEAFGRRLLVVIASPFKPVALVTRRL